MIKKVVKNVILLIVKNIISYREESNVYVLNVQMDKYLLRAQHLVYLVN